MKKTTILLMAFALMVGVGSSANAIAADGSAAFDATMNKALVEYLAIQKALAADQTAGVAEAANKIAGLAAQLQPAAVTGDAAANYRTVATKLGPAATKLAQAGSIDAMRAAFKELSQSFSLWVHLAKPAGINVVFCPMYQGGWLQKGADIRNPYYGASMPTCGEIVDGPDQGRTGGHMHR